MTHRERALAAIRHGIPDRVPIDGVPVDDIGALRRHLGIDESMPLDDYFDVDLRHLKAGSKTKSLFGNSGGREPYNVTPNARPFAGVTQVSQIERFRWPTLDQLDFVSFDQQLEALHRDYLIVAGNSSSVFCELCDFFGMEMVLTHMYDQPELIEAAVARVEDFYLRYMRRLFAVAAGRADVFYTWDDFASQRGMIFSPELWRRFFKPTYRKMYALAKSQGLCVWLHSCGQLTAVMPDLIEMGLDIWETVQAHLPGNEPEKLKREYGRHITFCGAISTQHTLPFGSEEEVRREVRERIKVLGAGGGYICRSDHTIKPDTPPGNIVAYVDEAKKFRFPGCTSGN